MKKLYVLLMLIVSFVSYFAIETHAETTDDSQVDLLKAKVDSLSHEIAYLKLSNEISTLNTELKLYCYDIESSVKDMKMDIYHNSCEVSLYKSYKELYYAYDIDLESSKKLVEAKRVLFAFMLVNNDYTDSEQDVLLSSWKQTDALYHRAEVELNMMNDILDVYYKIIY